MKTLLSILSLLALALASGLASANHNWCDNEASDIPLGFVGVDGPIAGDGNGEQVCLGNGTYELGYGWAPSGWGYAVHVCYGTGTTYDECDTAHGNQEILGTTGASAACGPLISVCLWVDGNRI